MEDAYTPFADLGSWLWTIAVIVIMALLWTMMTDYTSSGHGDGDSEFDDEEDGPQ